MQALFKTASVKQSAKISFTAFEKVIHALPKFIWTSAAIFGIFVFGFGTGLDYGKSEDEYKALEEKQKAYDDLIKGYEKLSTLYISQGENVSIILDKNMLYNHPEEVTDAIRSADQFRDMIILQRGRILELRRQADLTNEKFMIDTVVSID